MQKEVGQNLRTRRGVAAAASAPHHEGAPGIVFECGVCTALKTIATAAVANIHGSIDRITMCL